METRDFSFRSSAVADDGVFKGIASTFGVADAYGDIFSRGAFDPGLDEHRKAGTMPGLLWAHRGDEVLGTWLRVAEGEAGLEVEGRLELAVSRAREVHALMRTKAVQGLSIGYAPMPGGLKLEAGKRLLSKVMLAEISLTAIPSRLNARVHEVRSNSNLRRADSALREAGFSKREVKALIAPGWAVVSEPEQEPEHDPAEIERQIGILYRSTTSLKERYLRK